MSRGKVRESYGSKIKIKINQEIKYYWIFLKINIELKPQNIFIKGQGKIEKIPEKSGKSQGILSP